MQKSLTELLAADGTTVVDQNLWNRLLKAIDAALAELQGIKINWDALTDDALALALTRINDAILPAAQQIQAIARLGFLTAGSSSTVTLVEGEVAQFILSDDGRPELFTPTKWVVISRVANQDDIAIGTVSYVNAETRQFEVMVEKVLGSPGPFSDWEFSGQAGVVEAQRLLYEATQEAADDVSTKSADVTTKHDTVVSRYNSFTSMWYGGRNTAPSGAALGAAYVDTGQTPNVVKVSTSTGWAPAVSTSIGGSRTQDYPPAAGGETAFTVDGGFSVGDVFLNRQLRRAGVEVTFNPTAGTFTFGTPLTAGDIVSFRGYLANDAVDIYTKAEANSLLGQRLSVSGVAQTVNSANRRVAVDTLSFGPMLRHNPIINGDFAISQTGDVAPLAGGPRLAVDRWYSNNSGATISRQAFSLGDTLGSGNSRRFIRIDVPSGAEADVYQRLEGSDAISGRVTVLGWVRRPNGAALFSVRPAQIFGTGGSATVLMAAQSATAGTSWAPFAFTFDMPSVAGKILGSTPDQVVLQFFASSSVSGTAPSGALGVIPGILDLYGIHVRQGEWDAGAAAWYAPPDPASEMARCQRYFERISPASGLTEVCPMVATYANGAIGALQYAPKRAGPSLRFSAASQFSLVGTSSFTLSAISSSTIGLSRCGLSVTTSGSMTAGAGMMLRGTGGAAVEIDAELA